VYVSAFINACNAVSHVILFSAGTTTTGMPRLADSQFPARTSI
jgi:hypothetical protein